MAFDMYAGNRHEAIAHHEEYLFALAAENKNDFPQLMYIQSKYYTDFTLQPNQSNDIVHELLLLLEKTKLENENAANSLILRLIFFFSAAVRLKAPIKCSGD